MADWMRDAFSEAFRSSLSGWTGPLTDAGTSRTAWDVGALDKDSLRTMSGLTAVISSGGAPALIRTSTTWVRMPFPMIRHAAANTRKKATNGFRCSAVNIEYPRLQVSRQRVTSGGKQYGQITPISALV
jgi:hypothetical protein